MEKVNGIDLIHFHLFWITLAGILQYQLVVMLRSSGNVRRNTGEGEKTAFSAACCCSQNGFDPAGMSKN